MPRQLASSAAVVKSLRRASRCRSSQDIDLTQLRDNPSASLPHIFGETPSLTSFTQRRPQFGFGLAGKRRLQHARLIGLDFGEHFVLGYALKQDKEC
jgi:hypothetical protein